MNLTINRQLYVWSLVFVLFFFLKSSNSGEDTAVVASEDTIEAEQYESAREIEMFAWLDIRSKATGI